jgi:hypothetical protein
LPVKTKRIINQTITLLLAAMLLMVAGVKSWSVQHDSVKKLPVAAKSLFQDDHSSTPDDNQARVTSLSLDAVITPAISFDFCHYFYFAPQAVWHFIRRESVVSVFFEQPYFLFTGFARIFGTYIVTNAP